jgi:hypothetical protein
MDYEKKYKAALEWMRGMYDGFHGKTKKPKWTEEDKEQCDLLIEQLATLRRTLALDFKNEIKWLESLKQRMEEQ